MKKTAVIAVYGIIVLTYLVLAFKKPFGEKTLIPNLEPYPDTLYYSLPAWNLVQGNGLRMMAYGEEIKNIVPPLYSLYLAPFLGIFKDVRAYYFGNLILGVGSVLMFLWLTNDRFKSLIITGALGWVLATNFYFYNLPSLLMAENITIFLVLLSLAILTMPASVKTVTAASLVGIGLWLTKLSNLPLGAAVLLIEFIKIFKEKKYKLIGWGLLVIGGYGIYLYFSQLLIDQKNNTAEIGFAVKYFRNNFEFYTKALWGWGGKYLWYELPLINKFWSIIAVGGLIIGGAKKEWIYIGSLIIFMSFFYFPDDRYIVAIVPLWLMGAGEVLARVNKKWSGALIGVLVLVTTPWIGLKKQVGLNFRHAEVPWDYVAVKNFDNFLADKNDVILGTFLPPQYVYLISREKYQAIPIGIDKELAPNFRSIMTYQNLWASGKKIYVSNYYMGNNLAVRGEEWNNLKYNFELIQVSSGCLETCNLYEVRDKMRP